MKKDTILLLHGALGSKKQFNELAALLNQDFEVHCFNFSGHGGGSSDESFSMALFTQDVLDYLDTNAIDKTNILGYSMGGYVALKLALKFPERVSKIITLGTKFDWSPESTAQQTRMLNPDKIAEKVPQFAKSLDHEHAPADWKQVVVKTADMMVGLSHKEKLVKNDFTKIEHEVELLLGDKDDMVGREETTEVAQWLPNAVFHMIPKSGHPLGTVDIGMLAAKIKRFLYVNT